MNRRRKVWTMTIGEWIRQAASALTEAGCPDPAVDSVWIAEDILKMTRAQLRFEEGNELDSGKLAELNGCLDRRIAGEPVQYILQRADFMGLKFYVDKRVLIPRQDTETLVENAIVELQGRKDPKVLDLCCGSGCIGLSIKTLVPHAKVTLADISGDALDVAKKNAKELDAEASFKHGDLFRAIGKEKYDLIASNPPYIPAADMEVLQKEVRFEPELALYGGEDGLDIYRRIAQEASAHLNEGGALLMEVGEGEAKDVLALVQENMDCAESGIIRDLNGIERIVWARSR